MHILGKMDQFTLKMNVFGFYLRISRSRGPKNIEKPCKNGPGLSGTIGIVAPNAPHERQMHIFAKEMRPELRATTSETTTYISFLRQDPIETSSVWGIETSSVWGI